MNICAQYVLKFRMTLVIAVAFVIFIETVAAAPYQELEPRKGYVPVYIRYGDTPLSEIHPKLAAAFNESSNAQTYGFQSASLIKEKNVAKDETMRKETATINAKTEERASDIASFDVIKGKDIIGDAKA